MVLLAYITHLGKTLYTPRTGVGANPYIDLLEKMAFEQAGKFLSDWMPIARPSPIRSPIPCIVFGQMLPYGSTISKVSLNLSSLYPTKEMGKSNAVLDQISKSSGKDVKRIISSSIGTRKNSSNDIVPVPIDLASRVALTEEESDIYYHHVHPPESTWT